MCGQLIWKLKNPLIASMAEPTALAAPSIAPEIAPLIPSQILDVVDRIPSHTPEIIEAIPPINELTVDVIVPRIVDATFDNVSHAPDQSPVKTCKTAWTIPRITSSAP